METLNVITDYDVLWSSVEISLLSTLVLNTILPILS